MTPEEKQHHAFRTVRFVTNRGVSHELVRHRPASYSQESTRYVNYGGDDMQFIKPVWWDEPTWDEYRDNYCEVRHGKVMALGTPANADPKLLAMIIFFEACCNCEAKYGQLLKFGWRPEQAREVLPNSLKTEIIVTANIAEWQHIFNLRLSKAAHPQIRALLHGLPEIIML